MESTEAQSIPAESTLPPMVEVKNFTVDHSCSPPLRRQQQPLFSSPPATPRSEAHHYDHHLSSPYDENASSATDVDENAPDDDGGDEELTTLSLERRHLSGAASSISSFPASISYQHIQDGFEQEDMLSTPTKSPFTADIHDEIPGRFGYRLSSPKSARGHVSGFRNPSSVRAMQMRDEVFEDSDGLTPRHRRSGSRMSHHSQSSLNSARTSPSKRSIHSSPRKQSSKLRKEFPLVLLHCTLLPPSLGLLAPIHDEELLTMLLPEEYRKRWTSLRDRIQKDSEVKARGILVPHPQEDYYLLEERLLESLDLEKPRIRNNHFLKHGVAGSVDSGFDSASQTEEESDADVACKPRCPDCGRKVPTETDEDRKWEIKVYAANGLMRAGAWGAAWREMEKVDIEISVWLPEDVRREMESRLAALDSHEQEHEMKNNNESQDEADVADDTEKDAREREIYGSSGRHQTERRNETNSSPQMIPQESAAIKYLSDFLQDRRNLIMAILGVAVLFSALFNPAAQQHHAPASGVSHPVSSSSSPPPADVQTTVITSITTSITTVTETESVSASLSTSTTDILRSIEASMTEIATSTIAKASPETKSLPEPAHENEHVEAKTIAVSGPEQETEIEEDL